MKVKFCVKKNKKIVCVDDVNVFIDCSLFLDHIHTTITSMTKQPHE